MPGRTNPWSRATRFAATIAIVALIATALASPVAAGVLPARVKNINPGGNANPQGLTEFNGKAFFSADDGSNGRELWKSNGTGPGTLLVRNINAGAPGSDPEWLTVVNGVLYFAATGPSGRELWRTTGSKTSTKQVKDINPSGSSDPTNLTAVGSIFFFSANDGASGRELWKSDGTTTGTVRVKNIRTGASSSSPQELTNVNGTLFFTARFKAPNILVNRDLWKSDGSAAGTVRVYDFPAYYSSESVSELTAVGPLLLFAATVPTSGGADRELWKSNGTAAGTSRVKNINPDGWSDPNQLIDIGGTLFFSADDGTNGSDEELWKSNGTGPGTVRVEEINSSGSAGPQALAEVGGLLYFSADDGTNGRELWTSNGDPAGTDLVAELNLPADRS